MRKFLAVIGSTALLALAACGGEETALDVNETGSLNVTVSQALHQIDVGTIDKIEVTLYSGVWPTSLIQGTYELGYNGAEWTSVLDGIPAGWVSIIAKVYAGGSLEPVFVSSPAEVEILVGVAASTRIVLNQVELQEGIHAPVIDWITTSATSLRPGETVDIKIGFTDPDGDDVTVSGTTDDAGGTFSGPVTVAGGIGQATIQWTAPTVESGLAPEEIEVELTDTTGAKVRLQLFFRVIWNEQSLEIDFEMNLAPVVTSLRVDPANPVDGQGTPVLFGLSLGSLGIGFSAYDPDAMSSEKMSYEWIIPASCGDAWKWFEVWGNPVAPLWIDAEGTFGSGGTGVKSKDHLLAFPFNPAAVCTLTLKVTDAQGAMTLSTLVIKPFDVVTHYTPTIEISFQNGFEAVPTYTLDFGILSFLRIYDDFTGLPDIGWKLADGAWVAATPVEVPFSGPEFAFASTFHWTVVNDGVACMGDASAGYYFEVKARACNPVYNPVPSPDALCNEVVFEVDVPNASAADVCSNVPVAP